MKQIYINGYLQLNITDYVEGANFITFNNNIKLGTKALHQLQETIELDLHLEDEDKIKAVYLLELLEAYL